MKKPLSSGDLLISRKNSEKEDFRPDTDISFFEGLLIAVPICVSLWCAGYLYINFAFGYSVICWPCHSSLFK